MSPGYNRRRGVRGNFFEGRGFTSTLTGPLAERRAAEGELTMQARSQLSATKFRAWARGREQQLISEHDAMERGGLREEREEIERTSEFLKPIIKNALGTDKLKKMEMMFIRKLIELLGPGIREMPPHQLQQILQRMRSLHQVIDQASRTGKPVMLTREMRAGIQREFQALAQQE
jgi:hypothetical protein